MIDISAKVTTAVRDGLKESYPDVFVSGEYLRTVGQLPAVSIQEMSNYVPVHAIDSGSMELYARLMYQVDVYSADTLSKKTAARGLASAVDGIFQTLGFRRSMMQALPNVNNATIYRITMRFEAVCDRDGNIGQ